MKTTRKKQLERLQFLIGKAKGDYHNDRSYDRAQKVTDSLDEAFNIVVDLRERYSP